MKTQEFVIAQAKLAQFNARIKRLNEKARNYELPELEVTEIGRFVHKFEHDGHPMEVPVVRLQVHGEPIAKGPWLLVGALDERSGPRRLTLYSEVPVPADYLQDPMRCEHCKTHRQRKRTFLVMHSSDGFLEQVGHQCLAEYTGIGLDAAAAGLRLATLLARLEDEARQWLTKSMRPSQRQFALTDVLCHASAVLRQHKWVPTSPAENFEHPSTRTRVLDALLAGKAEYTEQDQAKAQRALAAAAQRFDISQDVERQFEATVLSLLHTRLVREAELGIAIWLIREFGQERAAPRPSQHVGMVGQRLQARVRVRRIATLYTDGFGATHEAITFADVLDNVLVWKTSRRPSEMTRDAELEIRATVKEHTRWRESNQTNITRVSVVS